MKKLLALLFLLPTLAQAAGSFNGSALLQRSTNLPASSSQDVPHTFSCQSYMNDASQNDTWYVIEVASTDTVHHNAVFYERTASWSLVFAQNTGNVSMQSFVSPSPLSGQWRTTTGVFGTTTSTATYVDNLSATGSASPNTLRTYTRYNIGSRGTAGNQGFEGFIAQCGAWNKALSQTDHNSLLAGFEPRCVQRHALASDVPLNGTAPSLGFDRNSTTALTNTAVTDTTHPRVYHCE